MKTIVDQRNTMMASLWIIPCTLPELAERLDMALFGVEKIMHIAEKYNMIYERGSNGREPIYHTYKATAKMLNDKYGFELDLEKYNRTSHMSEFKKVYLRSIGEL